MRTLEQLRKQVLPLPSLFAKSATGSDDISATLDYENGFDRSFSSSISGGGKYLLRNDFNRVGEIASRESHFKQAGGIHTFSEKVSEGFDGYPEGAMLSAYDGIAISKVESTESNNTKPFVDDAGNIIPNVIDCPVIKDDEKYDDEVYPRVLWKSVDRVYGTEEGMFSLTLDYTRAKRLSDGDIIEEDSLVIGERVALIVVKQNVSVNAMLPMSHNTTISTGDAVYQLKQNGTAYITNKGKCGDAVGYFIVYTLGGNAGAIQLKENHCPVVRVTGGTGNYHLSFFAKAGYSFSGSLHTYTVSGVDILQGDKTIIWTAIPIVPSVVTTEATTYD